MELVDRLSEWVAAVGSAVRGPIVVWAFAMAVGFALFWASSIHDDYQFLGPVGVERILRLPGHDPITGQRMVGPTSGRTRSWTPRWSLVGSSTSYRRPT